MQAAGEDSSRAQLTPWVYQLELLDMAKDRNIVAFLDTGSGKTFISVLLLKHRLEAHALQALADAKEQGGNPGPRWMAVFLAPKVALVQQQAEVLRRSLPVRVKSYVGSVVEEWWRNPSRWRVELEGVDVAVMTPQILQDLLTHGILPTITAIDTICFDEAHHCTGKHPYAMIMQFYHAAKGRRPRIFGLSAAPVSAGKKLSAFRLQQNIAALERNLDARIVTVVDRAPVEEVAPPPTLNVLYYPPVSWPQRVAALQEQLQRAQELVNLAAACSEGEWRRELQEAVGFAGVSADALMVIFEPGAPAFKASKLKEMLGAVTHVLQNLGPYCAALCALDAMNWLVAGAPEGERCYGASGAWRSSSRPAGGSANRGSAGHSWEVTEEQHAVNTSSAQLLHAFADLFLPAHERPAALRAALEEVDRAVGAKQPLRKLPVAVLQRILDSVTPGALQRSLEHTLRSTVDSAGANDSGSPPELPLLSAKAAVLVRSLQCYRQSAAPRNWTAIVFVQQRMTALALHRLLAVVPSTSDWVRSSPFMAQGSSIGSHNFVPKEQSDILKRFKLGEINLLVSTAVAEEGIDVKSCQLVVRFDLPPNAQSFLQSRGRARMKNSHLVVLVESGDEAQESLVQRMDDYEVHLRQQALANVAVLQEESEADSEEGGAASDTEEEGGQAQEGEVGDESGGAFEYRVPATGARVTLHTSLALLQRYTSKLPADRFMVLRPAYRIEVLTSGLTLAHVQLPSASPLLTAKGHQVAGKRQRAKASAALEACRQLHQLGALSDHLLPAALYEGEDVGDALAQASVANERLQAMVLDPAPPAALAGQICAAPGQGDTALHCYTWQAAGDPSAALNAALSTSGQRIGLILPAPLDSVAEMPRCHLDGALEVEMVYGGECSVHSAELAALLECSALLRCHAGGHCAGSNGAHNYALVPLVPAAEGDDSTSLWALDWATVREICSLAAAQAAGLTALDVIAQSSGSTGRLEGKVLVTPYNKMHYLYRGVAEGMGLNSTFQRSARNFPAGNSTAAVASAPAAGGSCTYADYYCLRWGRSGLDAAQPLLLATRAPNSVLKAADLAAADPDEVVHLVPELCIVHAVPAVMWPAVSASQSLLWQLEGTLAAQELQRELQAAGEAGGEAAWRLPPLSLLRRSITARSALDAAGDYESLETLGDAFLKYAVSAQLFIQHRNYHEGQLTALKMRVISNTALLRVGLGLGLDRRVRVAPVTEEGNGSGGDVAKGVVSRNSKVLADAVEALIGAFWAGAGEAAALALLCHLALMKPFELPPVQELAAMQGGEVEADLGHVEAALGYTFRAKWLGQEALTHGSSLGSRCYQRLEFLGDAVLDAGLTRHFYSLAPRCTPGELHNVRSAAVNSERLALAAVRHGMHAHVRHQSPALFVMVDDFTAEVERRVAELGAGGESSSGDAWHRLLRDNAFGLDTAAAPKVLSDVVESLIGAVWVDSGGSMDAAWRAAERLLQPLPELGAGAPINPLRRLRELAAQAGLALAFEVVQEGEGDGAGGGVVIRVLGDGALLGRGAAGPSRTAASRLAAQAVLAAWDGSAAGAGAHGGKRPKVAR